MSADQARVVVIGGGITGCSVAYHLALAGWTDVLLVEKAQLTAGSTCQAAGLVTAFNPSSTMMAFRRYSIELYERLGVFETVGSLRLASSRDQLRELERTASRARGIGLDVEVIGADEARRLMPAISPESLYGAVHLAGDGHLDPHGATHAVADAARALGVRIRTGVRVTGFELSARREITAVLTDARPDRHRARRQRRRDLGAAGRGDGRRVHPLDAGRPPAHRAEGRPRVASCRATCRASATRTTSSTARASTAGWCSAATSWTRARAGRTACRGSTPPARCRADYERFAPLMAGAIRRFPFLADAEAIRLVCHPDAMTPDANPLLGPLPGVRGFWVAAGLSLNGFGGGGGIGRAMAGWITAGDPGVDIGPYRAWRFGDTYRDPGFAAGLARETYSDYYRLRYPFDADLAGRPRRLSALHGRLQEAGAVFGTKAGWERADYHEPGRPWRRAGRDQAELRLDAAAVVRAGLPRRRGPCASGPGSSISRRSARSRSRGRGRSGCCSGSSANDVDRPVGSVVYTQWCDERGGMVADVTVTRLADDRFRVVTGAGYVASELAWLRTHVADDEAVSIRDVSGDLATIGLWGPRARDVLVGAGAAADEVSNDAIPMRRSRSIRVGPAPVDAARISYAGELGWELTTPVEWAVTVWDRLRAAGADVRSRALRLSSPRRPPDGEGLSLLRHRPDDARHPVRGWSRRVRPARTRVRSSGATRSSRRMPRARIVASGPSSSAAPTTNRSTAAKPSASTARSSVASEASPMARPSSARSATPTCRRRWPRAPVSRSMSSIAASLR